MKKNEEDPLEDPKFIKNQILEDLRHIEVIRNQSINRFDHQEVYSRVFQLIDVLEMRIDEWNHFFKNPSAKENQSLQDLFFNIKKLKQTGKDLKYDPQNFSLQQNFQDAIDRLKEEMHRFNLSL